MELPVAAKYFFLTTGFSTLPDEKVNKANKVHMGLKPIPFLICCLFVNQKICNASMRKSFCKTITFLLFGHCIKFIYFAYFITCLFFLKQNFDFWILNAF